MPDQTSSQQLLAQQLSQLKELETLLSHEKEILEKHDPNALNVITQQKNDLLTNIQEFDQHIGRQQQFHQDKASGLLQSELDEISLSLEKCQQLNQVNGQIIQHSQLAVERMKTSLLESRNKSSVTYDNKGKKSGGLSSLGIKA